MTPENPPGEGEFRWAAGFSEKPDLSDAIEEALTPLRQRLGPNPPDLALVFASPVLTEDLGEVPAQVAEALSPRALIGTTGAGVIGLGREAEGRPALSVVAGILPRVGVAPFYVDDARLRDLDVSPRKWRAFLGVPPEEGVHFLLFAHPFSLRVDDLVTSLDQAFPQGQKVGGLSSGGMNPQSVAVYYGNEALTQGAAGVALTGDVDLDTIVAQGCRPVGPRMKVTQASGTDIAALDGGPAVPRVMEVLDGLPEEDRELARHSLFVGVAMEGHEKEGEQAYDGGYLVRNIIGVDPGTQALRVGHQFHPGQTIRLQLRDARTARDELSRLLHTYGPSAPSSPRGAAFLFQCTGRGVNLFGREGHDSELLQGALGDLPMAGFFCNGEIGPVGEVTYLHGYTSSIGILRPKGPAG